MTGDSKDLARSGKAAEEKFDGTRAFIIKEEGKVRIQNRDGIDYSHRLPELVAAPKMIKGDFTIDGEIVYIDPVTGKVEFTPCQRRCSTTDLGKIFYLKVRYPIVFEAWDVLKIGSRFTEDLPYLERKELLRKLIPEGDAVMRYVPHRFDVDVFWEEVKQRGEEGLVLKDVNSRYEFRRSYKWLKVKNWREDVYDVVGFTKGKGLRQLSFGALVLAKDGVYRGLAGSGPNTAEIMRIQNILEKAPRASRPFEIGQSYTPVETSLRVEVKFYKLTESGVMRWPVFNRIVGV